MKRRILNFIITLTLCLNLCPAQALAAGEGTDGGLCPHHPAHTDECGYVPDNPDAPCTFACPVCPVGDLTGKLPGSVSENNSGQVQDRLSEIYALYDGLNAGEQQQVDLSPCISLQDQLDGTESAALNDDSGGNGDNDRIYELKEDISYPSPYVISCRYEFRTNGHTFTGSNSTAIQVTRTGELYLSGTVVSKDGAGIEIQDGGFLSITEPETSISGTTYALDIASGARVRLTTGTYFGKYAAIRAEDTGLAALLEEGYAYFDPDGSPLLPVEAAEVRTVVVNQCSDHSGKTFTHTPGTTTHAWSCPYCGAEGTGEMCTFTFDQDGNWSCACGNRITVSVDESALANLVYYDGTLKPGSPPPITLTLADGSGRELAKDADYEAAYEPRTDAGEITVTVTGITFNGTFTRTYPVKQAQPGISWDNRTWAVDYDSRGLASLPHITITINANGEDLHPYLQYFYRKVGDTAFTAGLPTNAGKYEVRAYLPESLNYKEAETNPYLTLTINKIPAVAAAPAAKTLTYNREAQELATPGVLKPGAIAEGAVIEFARAQNGPYSTDIPTGIGVSNYNVYYRVAATENYSGVSETLIKNPDTRYASARINHKEVKPTVELEYRTTLYTGGDKEPAVTVKDGEDIIPKNEYDVTYTSNRNVGTATVTVKNASNGNYNLTTVTATFSITAKTQDALSITSKPNTVIYGDQFTLSTQGGSGNGDVTWKITAGNTATVDTRSGQVTVTGHGSITVQATKSGEDPATRVRNYNDATASWTFNAGLRPVTATVTADDKPFDGGRTAAVRAVVEQGVLPGDNITITDLTGTFSDENAGANKTVTVDKSRASISGTNSGHYSVSYSSLTVRASINQAAARITTAPAAANLTYTGSAQPLVTGGRTAGNIGTIVYSTSQDGTYSASIPTGTGARKYTVWYKVEGNANYTGIPAAAVEAEIAKANPNISTPPTATGWGETLNDITLDGAVAVTSVPGTFAWKEGGTAPVSEAFYDVIFTPDDTANYNTHTLQVQVIAPVQEALPPPASEPDTPGTETNPSGTPTLPATTVENGTASTVVSDEEGSRLVEEAVANQSRNVVIRPEITGNVTKAEVSIPSSTVSRLGSETGAALTFSSPVADVTLSNEALDALGRAGGTVSVATEEVEQSVVLTLAANGETVDQVPGGLTLTVPAEDAGPGTVAVLVHDDGTRETIRKSVVTDGAVSIPLSGSATVEIVDNSKDFADVPPESWAADAVDFASSHELFNGTSETAFSPNLPMSRGMLATVLYRLEGSPELDLADAFNDVNDGAWYAEGVAWAVENGIADGYGNGQFGPDDNITREQFVVMLWRYAGCPEAGSQALAFADADQASSYALEALCWAVENGILRGEDSGVLDPGGTATRAQVAQLLKNFMENTR